MALTQHLLGKNLKEEGFTLAPWFITTVSITGKGSAGVTLWCLDHTFLEQEAKRLGRQWGCSIALEACPPAAHFLQPGPTSRRLTVPHSTCAPSWVGSIQTQELLGTFSMQTITRPLDVLPCDPQQLCSLFSSGPRTHPPLDHKALGTEITQSYIAVPIIF